LSYLTDNNTKILIPKASEKSGLIRRLRHSNSTVMTVMAFKVFHSLTNKAKIVGSMAGQAMKMIGILSFKSTVCNKSKESHFLRVARSTGLASGVRMIY